MATVVRLLQSIVVIKTSIVINLMTVSAKADGHVHNFFTSSRDPRLELVPDIASLRNAQHKPSKLAEWAEVASKIALL